MRYGVWGIGDGAVGTGDKVWGLKIEYRKSSIENRPILIAPSPLGGGG